MSSIVFYSLQDLFLYLAENKNWINGSPSWHESKLIGVDMYPFSDTPFNHTFVYFQCNFQQLDSSVIATFKSISFLLNSYQMWQDY